MKSTRKPLGEHPIGVGGIQWWHRIKLPTGYTEGLVNHGPNGGDWPTARFGMPKDLTNKTVIDVGCWDGFFSFEAENRGARSVLATDKSNPSNGFIYAKETLKSTVSWCQLDIERDIRFYEYDVVLCYGVLYHVKSPLVVLENLRKLCVEGGVCLLETAISNTNSISALEYKPCFEGDPTNFFYPNHKWIESASREVGFKDCSLVWTDGIRSTFKLS